MISESAQSLLTSLQPLQELNPHTAQPLRSELLDKAGQVPVEDFPRVVEFADALIHRFLNSSWKQSEKVLLHEFSEHLQSAFNQLKEAGEVVRATEDAGRGSPHSVALALPQSFSALEWFKLLEQARVPARLSNSIGAVVRRNQTTPTVLAIVFEVLLAIDSEQAFAWMNEFLTANRGRLDQDLVRDLLHSWRGSRPVPKPCLNWLFEWCGNEDLRQQWPAVVEEADIVLRRQLLHRWLPELQQSRSSWLRRLAWIAGHSSAGTDSLLKWQYDAISELGGAVTAFIQFSRFLGSGSGAGSERLMTEGGVWSREAIFQELQRIENLFTPIMLFADVILAVPDGSYRFAMSMLGFPEPILTAWREKLQRQTEEMVYQAVLDDLRADRQPIETIRTYSAGDQRLYRYLLSQLDLVSRTFGSLDQRDKVVEQLAVHFSSLREAQMLPRELTARYRKLMLTIHEDSLRRLLDKERFQRTEEFVVRRDLIAAAAAARRYIQRRRALHTSVEEMISSRFDFEKNIRQRRLQFARRFWSN